MREIKFRAWHKEAKVMANMPESFEDFIFLDEDGCRVASDCDIGSAIWAKNIDLMQFTGLQDSKGVDIYEGDIYHQGDARILYVVVFSDDHVGFVGEQLGSGSLAGLKYFQTAIVIVGNIHENPEFLEAIA